MTLSNMFRMFDRYGPCMIVVGILCSGIGFANEIELTFRSDKDSTSIYENEHLILTYQATHKSQDQQWTRANYLHPVYYPSGELLTEDFPEDHPHHRGVFWAWHQLILGNQKYGDAWKCTDFRWQVHQSHAYKENQAITIANDVTWLSRPLKLKNDQNPPEGESKSKLTEAVAEKNWITVQPLSEGYRIIDFAISLQGMQDEVQIGGSENVKGYGGFSVRMALDGSETFSSQGRAVTPKTQSIQAGHWINTKRSGAGITIINHTNNPGVADETALWILRSKRSMQNAAYPGRQPVAVGRDEPLQLRYRLVLHDGTLSAEKTNELSKQFQHSPPPW